MKFQDIVCKLGNMRKAAEWTLYPPDSSKPDMILIQCDKRIAHVNMATGKAMLSNGKGGHNSFVHLHPSLGGVEVDVPAEIITQLRQMTNTMTKDVFVISGDSK